MTQPGETETQLREFSKRGREKNFHLHSEDVAKVKELLIQLLAEEDSELRVSLFGRLSPGLPPDAVAAAVLESWPKLSDPHRAELVAWQRKNADRGSLPGQRLTLLLARGLLVSEPVTARQLLTVVCGSASGDRGMKRPNAKDAKVFRSVLLDDAGWTLSRLELAAMPDLEKRPLVRCTLTAAFPQSEGPSSVSASTQLRFVKWLLEGCGFGWLSNEDQATILQAARSWPTALREDLAERLTAFPEARDKLLGTISDSPPKREPSPLPDVAIQAEVFPPPALAPKALAAPPENIFITAPPSVNPGTWRDLLRTLEQQFTGLESSTREQAEQTKQTKQDLHVARGRIYELEREQATSVEATKTTQRELEAALAARAEELIRAEAALRQTKLLEIRLAEETTRHHTEAEALTRRIGTESNRQVEAYRNRLGSRLQIEHQDFLSIADATPTLENVESLRELLRGVFEALAREGVKVGP